MKDLEARLKLAQKPEKKTKTKKSPPKKLKQPGQGKDKQYTVKSKDFAKFADMVDNSNKAASDDEVAQEKHDNFLKSLSASINSYSLKEASLQSLTSSQISSPKKTSGNSLLQKIDSSSDELSATPYFHRKSSTRQEDLSSSSSDGQDSSSD